MSDKNNAPKWMTWLFVLFIIYAVINSMFLQEESEIIPNKESKQAFNKSNIKVKKEASVLDAYPALKKISNIDYWKGSVNPEYGSEVNSSDLSVGDGEMVTCGQEVTLEILKEGVADDAKAINKIASGEKEILTFKVGAGKAPIYFERAVIGMRLNGKRRVEVGPLLISKELEAGDKPYNFTIKLLKSTPKSIDGDLPIIPIFKNKFARLPASCGDIVYLHVEIWDSTGKKVFSSRKANKPIKIKVGENAIAHGIDRSIHGITYGEMQTLLIPPAFLVADKTTDDNLPVIEFDRSNMAVIEIEMVNSPNQEPIKPKRLDKLNNSDSK